MKKLLALITALICSFGALAAAGCNAGSGSDDNFVGLYDEVVKEEVTFTYTNDNMLYDFEEKEACYMNMSFDCIFGSASLNTDKKYLTCGNGSLKLDVYGRTDGSWSIAYFDIPSKYSDFTTVDSILVDVMYVTEDSHEQIVSLGVWSSNGNRCETEGRVRAKSGEWFTLKIAMHDVMYACTIGGAWKYGIKWRDDYMKNMTRLYISLPPFTQGQKPVTLYVDNVRLTYLNND